jgi:hypothetical protein
MEAVGGLGRQGAVRKRKEEIHEMNGHKFVQKQFYQLILCAFCNEFLLNALGYQCEDCRYTCHKKCYEKVVTKCISKSNTGVRLSISSQFSRNPDYVFRMEMRKRSTTGFLTVSNRSRTWEPTGVVTVVICCLLVERMLENALNVISPVMPIAPILSPTSVVCRWRRRTSSWMTGDRSTGVRHGQDNQAAACQTAVANSCRFSSAT